MKKLSNTEVELKKSVAYKKKVCNQLLFNQYGNPVWYKDNNCKIFRVNPFFKKLFATCFEQIMPVHYQEVSHSEN